MVTVVRIVVPNVCQNWWERVRPLGVRGGHLPVYVLVRNALGRVGSKPLPFSVVSLGTMRWTYVFNKCLLNSSMQEWTGSLVPHESFRLEKYKPISQCLMTLKVVKVGNFPWNSLYKGTWGSQLGKGWADSWESAWGLKSRNPVTAVGSQIS